MQPGAPVLVSPEKGKPIARWGRKVTGLAQLRMPDSGTAGLASNARACVARASALRASPFLVRSSISLEGVIRHASTAPNPSFPGPPRHRRRFPLHRRPSFVRYVELLGSLCASRKRLNDPDDECGQGTSARATTRRALRTGTGQGTEGAWRTA